MPSFAEYRSSAAPHRRYRLDDTTDRGRCGVPSRLPTVSPRSPPTARVGLAGDHHTYDRARSHHGFLPVRTGEARTKASTPARIAFGSACHAAMISDNSGSAVAPAVALGRLFEASPGRCWLIGDADVFGRGCNEIPCLTPFGVPGRLLAAVHPAGLEPATLSSEGGPRRSAECQKARNNNSLAKSGDRVNPLETQRKTAKIGSTAGQLVVPIVPRRSFNFGYYHEFGSSFQSTCRVP